VRDLRALDRARKNSLIGKADVLPDTLPEPSNRFQRSQVRGWTVALEGDLELVAVQSS